jgi:DNA-binding transcriptional ArsR family regulator
MWRIHLRTDDLVRVRLAAGADPMWELMHSVQVAGSRTGEVVFGRWRRRCRRLPGGQLGVLSTLAPKVGYSPDFLTPAAGTTTVDEGVEKVLGTPRRVLGNDLRRLGDSRPLPRWVGHLAAGEPASLRGLGRAMHSYWEVALAPYWPQIRRRVDAEVHRTARILATGGVEQLLTAVSPQLRWEPPVLTAGHKGGVTDIHPGGRGLVLQPSFFADDDVTILRVPGEPVVVAYPVGLVPGWCTAADPEVGSAALDQLLGRTRAHALLVLAEQTESTTGLAARLDVSVPSASQQAKILREAGLVISTQHGKAVMHHVSELGLHLLDAGRAGTTNAGVWHDT